MNFTGLPAVQIIGASDETIQVKYLKYKEKLATESRAKNENPDVKNA